MDEEQQGLAVRYIPLARKLAMPFKAHFPHQREEFESAAMLALVEAAEAFEPERNVRFATYARHRIWGALRDVQRSLVALGWRCDPVAAPTLCAMPANPEGKGRVLGAGEDGPVGWELDDEDAIEGVLRKLPKRHAEAMRFTHLYGMSQTEAAAAMGLSQTRISCMRREAVAMLNGTFDAAVLEEAC